MAWQDDHVPRSVGNRIIDVIFWILSIFLTVMFIYIGARDFAQRFPHSEDHE